MFKSTDIHEQHYILFAKLSGPFTNIHKMTRIAHPKWLTNMSLSFTWCVTRSVFLPFCPISAKLQSSLRRRDVPNEYCKLRPTSDRFVSQSRKTVHVFGSKKSFGTGEFVLGTMMGKNPCHCHTRHTFTRIP